MKNTIYILTLLLIFTSCKTEDKSITQLEELKTVLEAKNQELLDLKNNTGNNKGAIVHSVYFEIQDGLSSQQLSTFINKCKELKKIKEVNNFRIGSFEDLGDPRALFDFQLVMDMSFKNKRAYEIYQNHPIHLNLKESIGEYLKKGPRTYDFEIE